MPLIKSQKTACAFVSSSFGFGPVSKAAAISEEIKRRFSSQVETHFFGDRFALRFARQSKSFDYLHEAEVDDSAKLESIIPQLKNYEIVFSVLNLPLLPLWRKNFGRLFFVDSLAWMWKSPPAGTENAESYFAQDYLLPPERLEKWSCSYPIISIPPIGVLPKKIFHNEQTKERKNHLLVNFSGCFNQYVNSKIYEKYAAALSEIIISEASGKFEKIEICVNQQIAEKLKKDFSQSSLKIGQLPKKEFLRRLENARFLLTAPGITTTLEAIALDVPLGFLLPQNDSQAIMSEIYRRQMKEPLTMAFSRFDNSLAFPESLDYFGNLSEPIDLAVKRLTFILENYQEKIKEFITEMLEKKSDSSGENLSVNIHESWNKPGQTIIVEKVFEYKNRSE